MTSEDVANLLLFPILGDMDPSNIELSVEEEAMEVKLRKRMSGNVKLSHWVGAFSQASNAIRCTSLVRRLFFIFVVALFLIFHWLTVGLG